VSKSGPLRSEYPAEIMTEGHKPDCDCLDCNHSRTPAERYWYCRDVLGYDHDKAEEAVFGKVVVDILRSIRRRHIIA